MNMTPNNIYPNGTEIIFSTEFPEMFSSVIAQTELNDAEDKGDYFVVPIGVIVFLSIVYGLIALLAVLGNSMVLWIVTSVNSMHSVTNYFIANLAIADIIIGLFSIPFQFQAALLQRWNFPFFMCAFCPFFQTISVNVSIFTLTAIAIDRYKAIVHPFTSRVSKFYCMIIIGFIWFVGVLLAVPTTVAYRIMYLPDTVHGGTKPVCGPHYINKTFFRIYMHVLAGAQYFVPLVIIIFAYMRIGLRLWKEQPPGNAEEARDAHLMRNKKKVTKMMFLVVSIFALCWAPLQAYNIIAEIYPSINKFKYINYIWFCSHWLAMSSSSCNPFIYAIYNEKFKTEFRLKINQTLQRGSITRRHRNDIRNQCSLWSTQRTTVMNMSYLHCHESPACLRCSRAGYNMATSC